MITKKFLLSALSSETLLGTQGLNNEGDSCNMAQARLYQGTEKTAAEVAIRSLGWPLPSNVEEEILLECAGHSRLESASSPQNGDGTCLTARGCL